MNRSRSGRGATTGLGVMELHRTEYIVAADGQLIEVRYLGIAAHSGAMRDAVLNLKYHGRRAVAEQLALVIVDALKELQLDHFDWVVTWAPTSGRRRRERGFDQSEYIARHVGAFIGRPVRHLLRRTSSQPQTGHSRSHRLNAVSFHGRRINRQAVLLIDDVVTTGATFRNAAHELVRCGATQVTCIAPSRTV